MKSPTAQTYTQLSKAVAGARFPQNTAKIETILSAAFQQIEENLKRPYFLHKGSRPTRDGFGTDLPKGQRDETMLRNLLIAELFRSWHLAFEEVPAINNKDYPATKFVAFAEQIFYLLGIGKIEDHLEEFQSFRAKSLAYFDVNEGEVKK
ncbi:MULTISPECIES: hypothetical protein [Polynucleobacter]|jgi:hypothetical protein|uniref:Uncharacterized protein n=1 Tax=Polynucleobacter sphagniphilus TaxID=1743169 RepID=A0AA43M9U5_9BURK|nr:MULTISPECIES: hypothetical protein [Polynucleobacter]MDH6504826.1 hypothetical protein [Polynucleobacter sphagniphilus]MDH6513518.1 hypothetical protein [Polynucleobacter sphagniphilus]QWD87337.1 hypothetical protein AOC06_01790 [Polynucleobacter paludilacus]